jgi:F-type H+-transporting ATPase subunit b
MEKLGIEPTLLLAQILNFLIIAFVLTKILYKPILQLLDKRKKTIEEGLRLTQKMQEEEGKLEQKKQKILDIARTEAKEIIEEGRKQAKEEEKEILASARKEAEEIIQRGRFEVTAQRTEMEKDVKKQTVALAAAMTKRILASVLTTDDRHKLITKQIKELSKQNQ